MFIYIIITSLVDTLLDLIQTRVSSLMSVYDGEPPKDELLLGEQTYHDAVLKDLHSEEVKAAEITVDTGTLTIIINL